MTEIVRSLESTPRVHGELAKLGISISQAAVSKYMVAIAHHRPILGRAFLIRHQHLIAEAPTANSASTRLRRTRPSLAA